MRKIFSILMILLLKLTNISFIVKSNNLTIFVTDEQWIDEARIVSAFDISLNISSEHFLFIENNGQFDEMKVWKKFSFNLNFLRQEQIILITDNYLNSCVGHLVPFYSYSKYNFTPINFYHDFRSYFFPGEIQENQSFLLAALDSKTIFESRYFFEAEHKALIKMKFQWYYNDANELIIDVIFILQIENGLFDVNFVVSSDKVFFNLPISLRIYYL